MFPALREHLFSWWDPETKCSPEEVWVLKLYASSMCFNTHKITNVGHKVQLMNKKLDKIFAKFGLEKL
jgi:hypothetical protein